MTASSLRGISRLIAMKGLPLAGIQDQDTLGDADGPQIAVPAFDRVLLGVAVTAEQLDAVQPDLHALVGAELLASAASRANGRPCSARAAPRQVISRRPSSSMAMLAHMNATAWRRATGSPKASVPDVGDHVVQHRVRGADRQRGPAERDSAIASE